MDLGEPSGEEQLPAPGGVRQIIVDQIGSLVRPSSIGPGDPATRTEEFEQPAECGIGRRNPMQNGVGKDRVEAPGRRILEQSYRDKLALRAGQASLFEQMDLRINPGHVGAAGCDCGRVQA